MHSEIIAGNLVFQLPTPATTPSSSPTPYARARTLLRTSAASECTGRQTERDAVKTWIGKDNSGLLYISGGPGTGKTLIVNDTLQQTKLKFGYVNCTGTTSSGLLEAAEGVAASSIFES
jgi:cell division control protein 6